MTPCQEYTGSKKDGYGVVRIGGVREYAHRLAFAMGHGVDPAGMLVRHKCDNRGCVNPEHLELGTHIENMRDKRRTSVAKGENNPKAKLVEGDVLWARMRLALGATCSEVARALGVSDVAVGLIKRRETWGHI